MCVGLNDNYGLRSAALQRPLLAETENSIAGLKKKSILMPRHIMYRLMNNSADTAQKQQTGNNM